MWGRFMSLYRIDSTWPLTCGRQLWSDINREKAIDFLESFKAFDYKVISPNPVFKNPESIIFNW